MREPPLILVVDDVPDNVDILQMRLESQGYEVTTAGDGEAALAIIRDKLPDLVLLDIMMPKLDGIATVKQLKADTALPFTPVILVTARADAKDVIAGLEAGGDDYLTKPDRKSTRLNSSHEWISYAVFCLKKKKKKNNKVDSGEKKE